MRFHLLAQKNYCENSSVGRARPCQGRGRGFESRFSLKKRVTAALRPVQKVKLSKEVNGTKKFIPITIGKSRYSLKTGSILPGWWNGRHEGLKILWLHGCAGSSPASGTTKEKPRLIFIQSGLFVYKAQVNALLRLEKYKSFSTSHRFAET